jgi:hypothetical protein
LAPQLWRLALPLSAPLSEAVAAFNCLGEEHLDDPVAANVNGFLADGRFVDGLRHDPSAAFPCALICWSLCGAMT